jgi:hypothetical protein
MKLEKTDWNNVLSIDVEEHILIAMNSTMDYMLEHEHDNSLKHMDILAVMIFPAIYRIVRELPANSKLNIAEIIIDCDNQLDNSYALWGDNDLGDNDLVDYEAEFCKAFSDMKIRELS